MTTVTNARHDPVAAPAPSPRTTAIALILVLGSIMTTLDMTIVNVAINRLSQDFAAPLATVQWVTTGYSLALGAMIPATAWATGRFGARRLYLVAIALFTAGSLLAGAAWNIEALIFFRVLQGFGGGMIMPVGMTILIRSAAPDRLGRVMSTLGLAILVGPLTGPVLGGWLVDDVSWRWMFFINLPIGVAVIALAARFFPRDTPQAAKRLDVPGLLLLSPGLATLLYGVTVGGERHGFDSPGVLVPIVAGALLIVAFVARALTARDPLIDLSLFRDRTFAAAAGTLVLFASGYFGTMILAPLYYQVVRGESATMAGLLGIPAALASGTAMQVAGRLIDKVGPGRIVLAGITIGSTGFIVFTTQLAADTPYWVLMLAMAAVGAGGGSTVMPTMTAAARNLSHAQAPAGSSTVNLINTMMGAVGTAVASVLLTGALADRVPGSDGAVAGAAGKSREALAPALADAFQHTYAVAAVVLVLALVPAFLLPRRPAPAKKS
ncbi:DHA2 family efflux MFS transporter permease subunit [Actinomadura barringtoniae]|uniref:DHA2 family efflux MFS transporter permease subunit n=1 Tax=Actinomadura barringtoniae TaxID=1427535 RepID=A0A939PJ38_9ACTN|nr:DHA2 family efflux MFS transporter permease subunit [Actinomadura barringtoniae]MBO2453585.1 DHA2 family efflux MFS transporter permease subunit [Actinomadura barringtoniae]